MNILFVCTGNTCRSPMAEGFLKHKINSQAGEDCDSRVYSRGISVIQDSSVSINSVIATGEFGVDISNHIPMQLTVEDIEVADFIFTMTMSQASVLKELLPQFSEKIFSVAEYTSADDISDPYGGSIELYRYCAGQLNSAVDIIYNKLFKEFK